MPVLQGREYQGLSGESLAQRSANAWRGVTPFEREPLLL
jgi:hypothetical protein